MDKLTEDVEGSGEEVVFPTSTSTVKPTEKDSSIHGIPNVFLRLPKAPVVNPKLTPIREYRRKQATLSEYATISNRQTFVDSVLDFLGFRSPQFENTPQEELSDTLMKVLYNNARDPIQKGEKPLVKVTSNAYQCANGIEVAKTFNVTKFMGQWYQVMYSASNSNKNCRMMSYRLLNLIDVDYHVGSTFETLEYFTEEKSHSIPQMYSGFGMVNQPGELFYRSPHDNFIMNVVYTGPENSSGYYQYVILAVDCYYPLYVLARDPMVFQQRFESQALQVLRNKQLINDFSRALNFMKSVDFSSCQIPPSFFTGK
ncbi:hypothetical protein FO519_003628 [Halicephalobus sp. NKZ332]|nr:hypothetical protein FO519_003628 [Halicephalobus sp. NKZ332]